MNWPVKVKVKVKGAVFPVPKHLIFEACKERGDRA
jgi:hypothetical protein